QKCYKNQRSSMQISAHTIIYFPSVLLVQSLILLSGVNVAIVLYADTHELHLPSKNAYLAHRHTLRLSLFMRAHACAIALSLQYYTIAHIAPSPDTSCHHFELSDTSSALATHPIA